MTQRIARFSRGEVLRASRLNEVVDVINVGLASPQDATEATSSSGIPGTTLTTWTEVSRSGNTVTLQDSLGNEIALVFSAQATTWTVTSTTTEEVEVVGDACTVTVDHVTAFVATDANGNTMTVSGF